MKKTQSPFQNFDTLNYICKFLGPKEKFVLSGINRITNHLVDEHLGHIIKDQGLREMPDRNQRQAFKYYMWRNVRAVKIPTIFGKEESTHYNFLRGKLIVKIDAGKNFTAFRDNNGNVYYTKTSMLTSKYNPKLKFQTANNVRKAFGKGDRMFILFNDGSVQVIKESPSHDQVVDTSEVLEWSKRVPVVDMVVSHSFAIFVLGCVKVADVKKKIFLEEYEEDPNLEELRQQCIKILCLNLGNAKYTYIKYPYEQVKSLCVGCSTAYFVSPKNELYQCELLSLNEGQIQISVNLVPCFQGKSIVKVWSGFYYYIVLARSEDVLQKWDNGKVLQWLKKQNFDDYINIMKTQKVDGKRLLSMDKKYMADVLGIINSNIQQKMIMSIQQHQQISYQGDELYGWGKNDTGQLGNTMMQFVQKPIKIKMPQFGRNQHLDDIVCGWYNTIVISSIGRMFISTNSEKEKNKQQDILDEEVKKDTQKEKRWSKKSDIGNNQEGPKGTPNQEANRNTDKRDKKKKDDKKKPYEDRPMKEHKQQKTEKFEEESRWFEYRTTRPFVIDSVKDMLFMTRLAYKEEQSKKKVRTAKVAVDKVLWDPNLSKSEYKVGYFDKYMGTLEMPIEQYQKSEIKQHRLLYLKKGQAIVWHREDKIDLL